MEVIINYECTYLITYDVY